MNTPKKADDIKIVQITRGQYYTFGLGSDDKVYYWAPQNGAWFLEDTRDIY